jgi:hypothetical protein
LLASRVHSAPENGRMRWPRHVTCNQRCQPQQSEAFLIPEPFRWRYSVRVFFLR